MKILIVGAGISGLAAANRLLELGKEKQRDIEITVLESSRHPGGNISTIKHEGMLIEEGPDSFITSKPYALNLCNRLGLNEEIIPTSGTNRKTLIYLNGQLTPLPEGFILLAPTRIGSFISSPVLSPLGKLRALLEVFIPKSDDRSDESLHTFIKRRFGNELFENIAQPLIGGIYTSDPDKLSIKSAVPEIYNLERIHRSVIIGMIKGHKKKIESGARYSQFVTLRNGMYSLVSSLISAIPEGSLITGHRVVELQKSDSQWMVITDSGSEYISDGIILSTPSFVNADLLKPVDAGLSSELGKIAHASSAIAILAYKKEQIQQLMDGFGFVVPQKANLNLIACSFSSVKFEGRAPDDTLLIRCFVGGALNEEILEKGDSEIIDIISKELGLILKINGKPLFSKLKRYHKSMPQYNIGHEFIVSKIENLISAHKYLRICGNSYHGVGIPDCINSAEKAAEELLDELMMKY